MTSATDKPGARSERTVTPVQRLIRVCAAVVSVSVAMYVFLSMLPKSVDESMFPGPMGVIGELFFGIQMGLVAIGIVLVALRVRFVLVLWLIGVVLAVVYALLGLKGLRMVGSGSWPLGPRTTADVVVGTIGAVVGFGLSAVLTDARLAARLRFGLPAAVLSLTGAIWLTVYLLNYGT